MEACPFLLCLGDVYDCRVALNCGKRKRGGQGSSQDIPCGSKDLNGDRCSSTFQSKKPVKAKFMIAETTWKCPNYVMQNYNSHNSLGRQKGGPSHITCPTFSATRPPIQ